MGDFADWGEEIVHGELHEFDPWGVRGGELLAEFDGGAGEHVGVDERGRVEATAEDEDGFFVEPFADLHDLAFCGEEGGVGEAAFDELEGDLAVVDLGEVGAVEFEHVDLDRAWAEFFGEGFDERAERVAVVEGGVDEIDAEDAEGALLFEVGVVGETDVEEDFVGFAEWSGLEADAEPAVAFGGGGVRVGAGADGIAEGEERGGGAAFGGEPFDEDVEFVGEHGLETFPGDVARACAVDGIAHGHVVGGHGFGDGA